MFKNFLPKGLVARTLLILILPVFILQSLGVYLFYERHWDKLAQRLSTSVAGDIALIAEEYEQDPTFLNNAQKVRIKRYMDLGVVTGRSAKEGAEKVEYRYFYKALDRNLDGRSFKLYHPAGRNFTAVIETNRGALSIEVPKRRLYSSTTKIFVAWMFGLTFLLMLISAVLLRRQLKPILRLGRVGAKEDGYLKLEGADEVRAATAAFLDMQEKIKQDKEQKSDLLKNVRSDLQQPIDRMRLMLDKGLPNHPDTPAMLGDLRMMERMIDGYLSYTSDNQDEPLQTIKLDALIYEAKKLSGAHKMSIEEGAIDDVSILGRKLALTRAFANILRNAQNRDARLMVIGSRLIETDDGEGVLIVCEDDGHALSAKDLKQVMNPISAKLDKKHSGDFSLSTATEIIEGHQGMMSLSQGVKGLRISIMLPK